MTMTLTLTVNAMMCVGRAEKQKRDEVNVGFLNDNKNKAEEMRQVVEEAVMILMLLRAGLRKIKDLVIGRREVIGGWLNWRSY